MAKRQLKISSEQQRWDRILRREGLSLNRGLPRRHKLTYVNPEDLANVPDLSSDPEKILLAIEKVKSPSIVDHIAYPCPLAKRQLERIPMKATKPVGPGPGA